MVTEKLKLLNDQSYFLVSDVSVVCPRCGARLAANRSPVSLVPAGPGGFRCSPPRTRNAGAVGPHDPQVPVFRILLTRQLRTACAYRRTVAAGKVAGSFPRSGVRTTFACSSFLFPDCAAQSRTVRIAPHCVVPISRFGPCCTVRYRVVPRRSVRAAPYHSVRVAPECCRVVPCIPCKRSVPVPNHPVLPRSHRAVSCRSDRSAPRCAGSHGSARTVCAVPGCAERSVRAAPYRSVRVAPECCRVVPCIPCKRSVPVPNHPVLPRSHRAVSCRSDRSAPRCAGSHGSARTVCAVPGCAERSVRAAPYRSVRVAPECCRVVPCIPCKRSVPVPNHPVLSRSRRAGVQGMAYRGDGKSSPQPLPSPTGTAGRTVPMNRSLSLRPRPDRIRSETRGGSRSDAGDGSGECRKQQGAPWEAAPFLPSSRS